MIKTERIIISTEGKFQKNFNKFKPVIYLIFIGDKYEFVKDVYMQSRNDLVLDGEVEDDEEMRLQKVQSCLR